MSLSQSTALLTFKNVRMHVAYKTYCDKRTVNSQQRATDGIEHRELWDVFRLPERPVVGGERPSHGHVCQRHQPIEYPQQHEEHVALQVLAVAGNNHTRYLIHELLSGIVVVIIREVDA